MNGWSCTGCRRLKSEPFSGTGAPTWQRHKESIMKEDRNIKPGAARSVGAALGDELTVLSIVTIAFIVALWVAAAL
jgi:hypothetical protein